ncbi:hypothetical protein LCGC14_3106510, partial [marine sediment metagenome]
MRRGQRKSGKRSGLEDRIAKELDDADITYEYEPIQLEYDESLRKNLARCADCQSKNLLRTGWYTPDFVLASGLVIETLKNIDMVGSDFQMIFPGTCGKGGQGVPTDCGG